MIVYKWCSLFNFGFFFSSFNSTTLDPVALNLRFLDTTSIFGSCEVVSQRYRGLIKHPRPSASWYQTHTRLFKDYDPMDSSESIVDAMER